MVRNFFCVCVLLFTMYFTLCANTPTESQIFQQFIYGEKLQDVFKKCMNNRRPNRFCKMFKFEKQREIDNEVLKLVERVHPLHSETQSIFNDNPIVSQIDNDSNGREVFPCNNVLWFTEEMYFVFMLQINGDKCRNDGIFILNSNVNIFN